jgi:hypothetical protein
MAIFSPAPTARSVVSPDVPRYVALALVSVLHDNHMPRPRQQEMLLSQWCTTSRHVLRPRRCIPFPPLASLYAFFMCGNLGWCTIQGCCSTKFLWERWEDLSPAHWFFSIVIAIWFQVLRLIVLLVSFTIIMSWLTMPIQKDSEQILNHKQWILRFALSIHFRNTNVSRELEIMIKLFGI